MVNPASNSAGLSLNNFRNNHPSGQVRENDVVKPQSSFFRDVSPPKKRENVGILKKQGGGGSTRIPLPFFTVFNMGDPP